MLGKLAITVDVEEWYHSRWFDIDKILDVDSCEALCRGAVGLLLELFEELNTSATFFVLGEVAEKSPEIVEDIVARGHEVGCHGYQHETIKTLGSARFIEQLENATRILTKVSGTRPVGYRAPHFEITADAVNILEDLGYEYDSSVVPCLRIPGWYGYPKAPTGPYRPDRQDICKPTPGRSFFEIPLAVLPFVRIPGAGGWFLRNWGLQWTRTVVKALLKRGPVTLYVHSWEITDMRRNLRGIPFHVFRKTGRYVRSAIKTIVETTGAETSTIREILVSL